MSEYKEVRIMGEVEHNGPISMSGDGFGYIFCTKLKFDLSNRFYSLIIGQVK